MTPCPTCGRELGPQARFCGSCGTPVAQQAPPQQYQQPTPETETIPQQYPQQPEPETISRPTPYLPPAQPRHSAPRSLLMPIVAGVAVLALATTGVVVFLLPRSTSEAQPPATTTSAPTTTTTDSTTVTTTMETTTTTTPTPPTEADLRQQAAADHDTVETLVGQWVPQISSKKLGLVVNGVQFGYPEIMADYQSLKSRFPQAVLLNSNDYTNFSGKDFWVTVQATTFGTADEANAWCDQQGFAADDCYASRLMHTGGPAGNSKTR
jgi:serine/threonine-protein kinase